jgi:hypothetical protein
MDILNAQSNPPCGGSELPMEAQHVRQETKHGEDGSLACHGLLGFNHWVLRKQTEEAIYLSTYLLIYLST